MVIQVILILHCCSIFASVNAGGPITNTPPVIQHNREWRLTETEEVGSVVDRILAHDVEGDTVTISLSRPSSNLFNSRHDGYKFFTIDKELRVILTKSLRGMAGQTFLVGIKSSDGRIVSRSDVKVTVTNSKSPKTSISSFANAFAPGPANPSLIANIPKEPGIQGGGPPLLNVDEGTVWEVNSTAEPGSFIAKINAHDVSKTFLKLKILPRNLVKISEDGNITVAENLTEKVGRHKLKIMAINQHASIAEFATLNILGPGFNATDEATPPKEPSSHKPDHRRPDFIEEPHWYGPPPHPPPYKPKVIIIEKDIPGDRRKKNKVKGAQKKLVISLVVIFLILPIILIAMFFYFRYKKSKRRETKNKSLSVEHRGNKQTIALQNEDDEDLGIFGGIMAAVGIRRRSESNKYVDANSQKKLSYELSKTSTTKILEDEWEFPRHKLRFVDILGEGCFGQVWKCEAPINGSEPGLVAVKTLKEPSGIYERRDLLQEMKVYKSLGKHPNVVSFLGCCTEKDPIYMIIEYMVGGTLQNYLRNSRTSSSYNNLHGPSGSLTPKDLTIFALQIAKGMDFLSKNFIIHRDLAARNVLVGQDKVCKVADFGFARDVANNYVYERKSDGRLPIRWMAPESLFDNIFTTQSDVWSFGVLLWEIVTLGSTPYPGKSAAEVASFVKAGFRLEKPHHCRREIYNIMFYCWNANPSDRITFNGLIKDLDSLISKEVDYITLDNFPDRDYYNFNTSSASGELL